MDTGKLYSSKVGNYMSDIQERIMDQLDLWLENMRLHNPYAGELELNIDLCNDAIELVTAIENNTLLDSNHHWSNNEIEFYRLFGRQPIVLLRQCINDFML